MRDLIEDYRRLTADNVHVGRGVVTTVWGSAPRPPGACLLATADGRMAGSVSGGCVEGATATEIAAAIERGTPKVVEFGVSDELAWEVGLACGGTIRVLVEPVVRPELLEALQQPVGIVLATVIDEGSPAQGAAVVISETGETQGPFGGIPGGDATALSARRDQLVAEALEALTHGTSRVADVPDANGASLQVFLEVHARQPRLVIFGGVHIAKALVTIGRQLGFRTIVADGRQAFVTRERFPDADELVHAWPEEAFERIGLDAATYVCVLSHDPKFDDPAVQIALRSPAPYVGAIGSRKTQGERRQRLKDAGITDEQLARLKGPIGLKLGGRQPAEVALGILAEVTAVRYGTTLPAVG